MNNELIIAIFAILSATISISSVVYAKKHYKTMKKLNDELNRIITLQRAQLEARNRERIIRMGMDTGEPGGQRSVMVMHEATEEGEFVRLDSEGNRTSEVLNRERMEELRIRAAQIVSGRRVAGQPEKIEVSKKEKIDKNRPTLRVSTWRNKERFSAVRKAS